MLPHLGVFQQDLRPQLMAVTIQRRENRPGGGVGVDGAYVTRAVSGYGICLPVALENSRGHVANCHRMQGV
jgi:hypothetical protein